MSFGVEDWRACERFAWCVGHRPGADADGDGHAGAAAVYADVAVDDAPVTLDVEVDAAGWASVTLNVGEWVGEGPAVLAEFDRLVELVTRARADAARVVASM